MLGVVVAEKRWMIVVGLSRCRRWRWQPARHLVQEAPNPRQSTDDACPRQSGLKPAARIARTALQQHLCSGHVAKGIPQPLAAPGKVMVHQQAAVVAAADQEGDDVFAPRLDVGCDLPMGRQAPNRIPRADGDDAGGAAQAQGLIKMRKAQLQLAPEAAHAHHTPGLVGREQVRQLLQRWQVLAVLVEHADGHKHSGALPVGC